MKFWSYLFIAVIISGGVCLGFFLFSLKGAANISLEENFEIKQGDGFNQIAVSLKNQRLIKSDLVFKIYAVLTGSAHLLKPGLYNLNAASTTPEILRKLIKGPGEEIEVVIPEGFTLYDIDSELSDSGILQKGAIISFDIGRVKNDYEFLKSENLKIGELEGYLYPDTYRFFKKSDAEIAVRKFLDNFNRKVWPLIKDKGPRELLIMASMIEKEVPDNNDRLLAAGILYKRLSLGMPLQVDATVVYAKCSGYFVFCSQPIISQKDLNLKSPYNTYLYTGLPPAPISNPGLNAINAALNPKFSDYLYYLSDPKTAKTIFSRNFEEHKKNKEIYLK